MEQSCALPQGLIYWPGSQLEPVHGCHCRLEQGLGSPAFRFVHPTRKIARGQRWARAEVKGLGGICIWQLPKHSLLREYSQSVESAAIEGHRVKCSIHFSYCLTNSMCSYHGLRIVKAKHKMITAGGQEGFFCRPSPPTMYSIAQVCYVLPFPTFFCLYLNFKCFWSGTVSHCICTAPDTMESWSWLSPLGATCNIHNKE